MSISANASYIAVIRVLSDQLWFSCHTRNFSLIIYSSVVSAPLTYGPQLIIQQRKHIVAVEGVMLSSVLSERYWQVGICSFKAGLVLVPMQGKTHFQ